MGPHLSIMACTTSSGMPALVFVASSVTLQAFHSPGTERHPVQLVTADMAEEVRGFEAESGRSGLM